MYVVFVHSRYCPKCELAKYGETRGFGEVEYGKSAIKIVREVCACIGVPFTEVDVGREYECVGIPVLRRGGVTTNYFVINHLAYWVSETIGKTKIELPGFMVRSSVNGVEDRFIELEMVTETPRGFPETMLYHDYTAARQCLRAMARTAIDEKLAVHFGRVDFDLRERILEKLFPVNEEGAVEPNMWRWIEAFIKLRNMKVRM